MQGEMGSDGMGRNRRGRIGLRWLAIWLAAFALAAPAMMSPAAAQFSASYNFLKAVRDGEGQKVMDELNKPGNSMLTAADPTTGETALHIVTKRRDKTYLGFFLGRGADPNLRDRSGTAPLLLAAQLGWVDGASTLLGAGARIDLANNSGETPLIFAVHNRDLAMARLLIASGADPKRSDRIAGKSALDYAQEDPRAGPVLKILNEARPHTMAPDMAGPTQR